MLRIAVLLMSAVIVVNDAPAQEASRYTVPVIKMSSFKYGEFVPDLANISLGVVTEKKTASEAAAENAKTSTSVIDFVKGLGVEPRDIRTLSVTVSPNYDEERDPTGRVLKRTLRGYTARNSLDIRVRQVDKAGAIARQLIDRGANQFNGIYFTLSDAEKRLDELRVEALKETSRKAKSYAEALGVKLGKVLEIEPNPSYPGQGEAAELRARTAPSDRQAIVIPVEPGVKTLSVNVTVVWALVE